MFSLGGLFGLVHYLVGSGFGGKGLEQNGMVNVGGRTIDTIGRVAACSRAQMSGYNCRWASER
jgi:hypothetical protein